MAGRPHHPEFLNLRDAVASVVKGDASTTPAPKIPKVETPQPVVPPAVVVAPDAGPWSNRSKQVVVGGAVLILALLLIWTLRNRSTDQPGSATVVLPSVIGLSYGSA